MAGPTMLDLARQLDLSVSTISRALRDDERILPHTRARVKEAAQKLGYEFRPRRRGYGEQRKNSLPDARPGHSQLSRIRVVVRGRPLQLFYGQYINELIEQGRSHGFLVQTVTSKLDLSLTAAVADGADGLVIVSWELLTAAQVKEVQQASCPVVFFNRYIPGMTYAVTLDDAGAGAQAAEYLLGLGHRRIAHMPGPQWSCALRERTAAFRSVLETAGCYRPEYQATPHDTRVRMLEWARSEVDRLLSLPEPPTAIWAYNDLAASIAVVSALARGMRVPEDLSVMGFNHTGELQDMDITSFGWQFSTLAGQTIALLKQLRAGELGSPVRYCIAPLLLVGRTTGPAAVYKNCATE